MVPVSVMGPCSVVDTNTKRVENGHQSGVISIPEDRMVSVRRKVNDSRTNLTLKPQIWQTGLFLKACRCPQHSRFERKLNP